MKKKEYCVLVPSIIVFCFFVALGCTNPASSSTTYSVTYNGNGNTGGAVPSDSTAYTSGQNVTVKSNSGSLVKTGYSFSGWNTAADGSGTSYTAGATFTMGSTNVALYAQWTSSASSTWKFGIISDADATTSLVGMSASQPLNLDVYNATDLSTRVGRLQFTDKSQTQSITGLTPGATYIAIGYSDRDNNGLSLGDWLGPMEAMQSIPEGESTATYYPWMDSNISPQRAISDLSFVFQFAYIKWSYTGSSAFSTKTITTVVTSNPDDVTDHTSWIYYPNGGGSGGISGERLVNGLDPSKTYGLFIYDDSINPYHGNLDSGEKYYWAASGATFPALPAGQRFQAHDLTQAVAAPTSIVAGSTIATY